MKTFLFALVAAILIAGQFFTPVAAASSSSEAATACGDTYTVQPTDYVSRIAKTCGLTVSEILALNPQILYADLIYTGQVIRLTTNVPVPSWPTYTGGTTTTTTSGYARVSLSTTWTGAGNAVIVYVSGFPANSEIDYRVGRQGESFSVVYDGTVASNGAASKVITIPTYAVTGEYWVVQVITTSLANVVSVTSHTIYIGTYNGYTGYYGYARVSLSATRAAVGDDITVSVGGFPSYSEIDYRVGKQGESFTTVYDGTVASNGATSQVITIPASAAAGEYWVVQVITTSLANITTITSHTIYITG